MKRLILFGALCLPAFLAGCIHNDLPYPVVTINIEAIEAEGLDGAAQINAAQQTVILPLLETTDIRNVHITSVTLTEGGQSSVAFPGTFDLRTPLYTTLSLYQEYGWSIAATQTIERYFRVKKQVGAAEIDPANRTATAYVSRSTDLQNVPVKELKLGPAGITTYSPEIEGTTSFETVRLVDVTAHGRTEQWRLRVVPTDVTVRITQCDTWARIAWLAADGLSDTEMGFVYRRKGDTEWLAVPDVEIEGGTFRAKLAGLDPETTYELKAFSDTDLSDMREFTTEAALQLPNAGFETWSTDRSDILYPYAADAPLAEQFWGSGNPGSTESHSAAQQGDPQHGAERVDGCCNAHHSVRGHGKRIDGGDHDDPEQHVRTRVVQPHKGVQQSGGYPRGGVLGHHEKQTADDDDERWLKPQIEAPSGCLHQRGECEEGKKRC